MDIGSLICNVGAGGAAPAPTTGGAAPAAGGDAPGKSDHNTLIYIMYMCPGIQML